MCKVFEFIDKKIGSFFKYIKFGDVYFFIIDVIFNSLDIFECVFDSDVYFYWRMCLVCIGYCLFFE